MGACSSVQGVEEAHGQHSPPAPCSISAPNGKRRRKSLVLTAVREWLLLPVPVDAPKEVAASEWNTSLAALASQDAAACGFVRSSSNDASRGAQISLFAPPPSTTSDRVQPPVVHNVVTAPALARIDELEPVLPAAAETHSAAAAAAAARPIDDARTGEADGVDEEEALPDYDRMFGPSDPEYVEYRQAWHRAQEEFSSPATPRSLMSPIPITLEEGSLEACTVLDILVASSRPRTGRHTPAAARTPRSHSVGRASKHQHDHKSMPLATVSAGAMLIPPQVKAAATKADTLAAQHNASLVPESSGSMDWAAVSASLHQWQVESTEV